MTNKIMAVGGFFWTALLGLSLLSGRPTLLLLPLCGLYPGQLSSGAGYQPHLLVLWEILFGLIFMALGFVAIRCRSLSAAIAFLLLFLVSSFMFFARASEEL